MLSLQNPTLPMTQAQLRNIRAACMRALKNKSLTTEEVATAIEQNQQVTRSALIQLQRTGFVQQHPKTKLWSRTTTKRKS